MALLDIIITHHTEPFACGRKMFEMLKNQLGIRKDDFRVIFVQDGPDAGIDLGRLQQVYPFTETVITQPQMGVSAARNAGLEEADAEWVMFCDFDDCLYTVDSMYRITESIRQAGEDADLLWSDLWIEMRKKNGDFAKVLKGFNSVFIHGKVYRRQMLTENVIRFDEDLDYSEDAMFNAIVMMTVRPERIAKMPEAVYIWCYREGSLSNYEGGDEKRNLSLYKKRVRTCEAYWTRGDLYNARCAAARAMLDYYWEMNGARPIADEAHREEWLERIRAIPARWPGALGKIRDEDRRELEKIAREEARQKGFIRDGMPGIRAWLREIRAI